MFDLPDIKKGTPDWDVPVNTNFLNIVEEINKIITMLDILTGGEEGGDSDYFEEKLKELEDMLLEKINDMQNATEDSDGLMSLEDKKKLDGIEEKANKTILNDTLTSTSITEAATANAVRQVNEKIEDKFSEIQDKLDEIDESLPDLGGDIVSEEEPEGNENKLWINPTTGIAYYWYDEKWNTIAGTAT